MGKDSIFTTFYIVRHGQTNGNLENRMQGHADIPLNETGKKQAWQLAQVLKDVHFDEIISSNLSRALETAKAVALERKMEVKATQALREKTYGSYELRFNHEVKEELKELFDQWEKLATDEERLNFRIYTDGETDAEAVTRMINHLREVAVANPGKTILVGSHGGIMRYFLVKLGWATYKELGRNSIKNTAYIKVESDGVDFFVKETYQIEKTAD